MFHRLKYMFPHISLMLLLHIPIALLLYVLIAGLNIASAKQDYKKINWESLDLSVQQQNRMDDLDQQWKTAVSELAPRINTNEKKLTQLMKSSKPSESEIIKLQQQIHDDKAKLKIEATQIFLMKRKLLKKDQEQKLMQMINM